MSRTVNETNPSLLPLPDPVLHHHFDGNDGNPGISEILKEWLAQKRVPPVLLLTGTPGVGKRALAHYLAQWILCEKSGFQEAPSASEDNGESLFGGGLFGDAPGTQKPEHTPDLRPCGECPNCHRALHGNWVDFIEVQSENEESETLKIDQFRQLKSSAGFAGGASDSAYRIILIPDADRMTTQAANSILKLLEEPPRGWIFFLTASDKTLLLPTIVSRCQTLRLKPFSSATLRELLSSSGIKTERIPICAELAQGSWTKAQAIGNDETWEKRKDLFSFLEHPALALNDLIDWASAKNEHFVLLVDQLELLIADLIAWSVSDDQRPEHFGWKNGDGKTALSRHATQALQRFGTLESAREFWLERAERLARVRQEAHAPLNRKLLLQDILVPWLGLR